jgi:hypothetical protein
VDSVRLSRPWAALAVAEVVLAGAENQRRFLPIRGQASPTNGLPVDATAWRGNVQSASLTSVLPAAALRPPLRDARTALKRVAILVLRVIDDQSSRTPWTSWAYLWVA